MDNLVFRTYRPLVTYGTLSNIFSGSVHMWPCARPCISSVRFFSPPPQLPGIADNPQGEVLGPVLLYGGPAEVGVVLAPANPPQITDLFWSGGGGGAVRNKLPRSSLVRGARLGEHFTARHGMI
jgi:hypothetical protein